MKTVKQIADEIGIPKQRLYRYIKNHITDVHQENGVMYIDDVAESLIKQGFFRETVSCEVHHDVHHDAVTDAVIDVLRKELNTLQNELDIKNEQLKDMNARLAESNAALLVAQQTAQDAQALHAGTIQQQLTDGKRKGFWNRWRKNDE